MSSLLSSKEMVLKWLKWKFSKCLSNSLSLSWLRSVKPFLSSMRSVFLPAYGLSFFLTSILCANRPKMTINNETLNVVVNIVSVLDPDKLDNS